MKQIAILLCLLCAGIFAQAQDIPARPNPPKLVNDLAGMMSQQNAAALEQALDAYDDSTSIQIAVVTVPSLNGADPEEYAVKLGRTWGVGNKQNNNGVVFLVSKEDRQVFIATGYGTEGGLPDITAKSIIENQVVPNFKAGNYDAGIDSGAVSIMLALKGEYKAPPGYHQGSKGAGATAFFIILFIVIFIIWAVRRGGGPGGGYISRRGSLSGPLFWGAVGGMLGGGGRGGGGGGFGGGGGGGFGGFGGGSFGGGGAGGSW